MLISPEEYAGFRQFLENKTGILLGDNKQYLVASRLSNYLKENSIDSLDGLLTQLKRPGSNQLLQTIIDKMTTNETLWFRDSFPFEYLVKTILPEVKAQSGFGGAKIWCAACSTGQEPYSISMAIEEEKKNPTNQLPAQVDMVATDISSRVLDQAKMGKYQQLEISRGLSVDRQKLHFDRMTDDGYQVKSHLRSRVRFSCLNLLQMPYSIGKFDVIFCRNVLIYFSAELKTQVIENMAKCLKPRGYLFLGASESMPLTGDLFEMVRCNPGLVYRLK
ncbi:protein-glutamate O-methyltransferase CheR [Pleionea sp. CnH1-48]|uniref:CheR family methyltransferase n=1 Tax=Pleionea sp. CnH1-48 TaxID=2954494 RepID=UPI0020969CEB|nr:protein-glutamate O-methyltransferase CheR [Pleionea sp. CnH1-48]MCO7226162.1 protein-glutamate O-methyltransferase CheR [Pleionea sp. CnH1-48]